ncbi:MAG: HigA family addiction module antitoxin [Candidatus Margulisiibacteriota bacterium]
MHPPNVQSSSEIQSPGEVIESYIIKGLGIGVRKLAHALNVPPNRIYQIIHNKRELSVDTAIRLGLFLNMDPHFWLDIQNRFNISVFLKSHSDIKNEIQPLRSSKG